MNEKSKQHLNKLNDRLITSLESTFKLNVYQDSFSDSEQLEYHAFVFETGGFSRPNEENKKSLIQPVYVRYLSENRDDLDERMLDIVSLIESAGYIFQSSEKTAIQKGETDSYIDEIMFTFNRVVKYGC